MILRLQFQKHGPVRFISHRDVARAWERAFRRARLPLAFSEGFSPHPKVSFGLALPTGWESDAEYLDVTLTVEVDLAETAERLNAVLPGGMAVVAAAPVPAGSPSVASIVHWADYLVAVMAPGEDPPPPAATLREGLAALASASEWWAPQRKKGQAVANAIADIRPLVALIDVVETDTIPFAPASLSFRLATQPRVVRPDEVCVLLSDHYPSAACEPWLVRRTSQLLSSPGDPLWGPDPPSRMGGPVALRAPMTPHTPPPTKEDQFIDAQIS